MLFLPKHSSFFISPDVTQSCLTLCDPMDCSPSGSSLHGIHQARMLEWALQAPEPRQNKFLLSYPICGPFVQQVKETTTFSKVVTVGEGV